MRTHRLLVIASVLTLGSAACRGAFVSQDEGTALQAMMAIPEVPKPSAPVPRTENDLDRTIRVQLEKSFWQGSSLKDREISFHVNEGDVTLTGIVRADSEVKKSTEIAMAVPGVRSVANALRVSP